MGAAPRIDSSGVRWLAVLDFEATCWDGDKAKQHAETEIIEFPTVLYRVVGADGSGSAGPPAASTPTLELAGEWRAFVRPVMNPVLSPFCTRLTGITQSQVDAAAPLADVLAQHASWLAETTGDVPPHAVLFVTCGHWDLGTALPLELRNKPGLCLPSPVYGRWANLKDEFAAAFGVRSSGMAAMLATAGLPLEGHHHSGLDDSRNIGRLLEAVWRKGRRVFAVRSAGAKA